MRIGMILHGPEIIDIGSAERIIDILKKEHEVIAKLGGTMGRTAVIDSGLEDVIDISMGLIPSETIIALKDSIDLAVLLNHGKTLETGRYFGRIVASKLGSLDPLPFIHIERPDSSGRIIYYSLKAKTSAEYIRDILVKSNGGYDLPIERGNPLPPDIRLEGDKIIRRLLGAFPGENIRLEGIIIGYVTSNEPEIVCKDGTIVELRGGKIKLHGLEKLAGRRIDLLTAKVKTGNIRRSPHKSSIKSVRHGTLGKIAIIDHCAESTFELMRDSDLIITVGDDTTSIAADILTRFGIPIIGITDGDLDCILEDTSVPAGSVILRVREGHDDVVGKQVFKKLMHCKQQIHLKSSDELLARVLALAEKYIVETKYY